MNLYFSAEQAFQLQRDAYHRLLHPIVLGNPRQPERGDQGLRSQLHFTGSAVESRATRDGHRVYCTGDYVITHFLEYVLVILLTLNNYFFIFIIILYGNVIFFMHSKTAKYTHDPKLEKFLF